MSFEEVIKNPIFSYLIGIIIFITQLLLRSKLDEMKEYNKKNDTSIKELYDRTDKIPVIEKDVQNFRDECKRNHK